MREAHFEASEICAFGFLCGKPLHARVQLSSIQNDTDNGTSSA